MGRSRLLPRHGAGEVGQVQCSRMGTACNVFTWGFWNLQVFIGDLLKSSCTVGQ